MKLFEKANYKTEEGYRTYIQQRILINIAVILFGVITFIVTIIAESKELFAEDFMLGVYEGVGTGLVGAGVMLLIRNLIRLNNKDAAKKGRIEINDERNLEIYQKAIRIALFIMLIAIYIVMLIGGLWYPILTKVLSSLVCLFLFSYVVAYKMIEKKM